MKPNLFLRSSRSSRGRSRSGFWLALFLHFAATTTAARRSAARATTAALMTATTAAFATAALATATHREAAAAAARSVREHVAEAATERTAVATTARLTAAVASRLTAATATAAATVASEPESIGAAREGQHGHDQSETMKIHLTHLHLRTRPQAADVRHLANRRINGMLDKRRSQYVREEIGVH
jgi:hypothetical protein